jgi:hypothetical protein
LTTAAIAGRALGAEIDDGVRREGVAVIAVAAGIGGRRMAGDQMKDRKSVLDRTQAILKRLIHETMSSAVNGGADITRGQGGAGI